MGLCHNGHTEGANEATGDRPWQKLRGASPVGVGVDLGGTTYAVDNKLSVVIELRMRTATTAPEKNVKAATAPIAHESP